MKKILMAMALLATSSSAFAQTGSLTIQNHTAGCKFYPGMSAISSSLGNGTPCDLEAFTPTIYFAPATTWANPNNFTYGPPGTGIGWTYEATAVPAASWPGVLDFVWLEVWF